jgi:hypothetical protein
MIRNIAASGRAKVDIVATYGRPSVEIRQSKIRVALLSADWYVAGRSKDFRRSDRKKPGAGTPGDSLAVASG